MDFHVMSVFFIYLRVRVSILTILQGHYLKNRSRQVNYTVIWDTYIVDILIDTIV